MKIYTSEALVYSFFLVNGLNLFLYLTRTLKRN